MPTYEEWNNALIDYFTTGVPRGATIFLDVNDDVLTDIGRRFAAPAENNNWTRDFQQSVRGECVTDGRVRLGVLCRQQDSPDERPRCVAFLAAMVLAAYVMSDDDADRITSTDYFRRLREVLGLEDDEGRPRGMKQGSQEEDLWNDWARWLLREGFLPTAEGGEGPQSYIRLPISQSILRQADKDKLFALFEIRRWPRQLDADIVGVRLRREPTYLSKHTQRLLQQTDVQRYRAINQAVFEVYDEWAGSAPGIPRRAQRQLHGTLSAGLYRVADPFLDTVIYYLYPQQPRRFAGTVIQVRREEHLIELIEQRPAWYEPLWPVQWPEINNGAEYELVGDPYLQRLVLPVRDFWILVPDSENPESGVYASWERPELGTKFVLLCKEHLGEQINHLRDERLIQWSGDPVPISADKEWMEYRGVMAVSKAWEDFGGINDLYDSLRPAAFLSGHFSGGIRVPSLNGWLVGCGPAVTVVSFHESVQLTVQSVDRGTTIFEEEVRTNQEQIIPWPGSGNYSMVITAGAESRERLVKIVNWDELSWQAIAELDKDLGTQLGTYFVYGPLVRKVE